MDTFVHLIVTVRGQNVCASHAMRWPAFATVVSQKSRENPEMSSVSANLKVTSHCTSRPDDGAEQAVSSLFRGTTVHSRLFKGRTDMSSNVEQDSI